MHGTDARFQRGGTVPLFHGFDFPLPINNNAIRRNGVGSRDEE